MSNYEEKREWAKAWHDEKEEREAAKAEKETRRKKYKAMQSMILSVLTGAMALYLLWMCYKFVSNF